MGQKERGEGRKKTMDTCIDSREKMGNLERKENGIIIKKDGKKNRKGTD